MAWRNMLPTQKIQQYCSITVDDALWDNPACIRIYNQISEVLNMHFQSPSTRVFSYQRNVKKKVDLESHNGAKEWRRDHINVYIFY